MFNPKLRKVSIVLAIIGIFLASYLLFETLHKTVHEACYINSSINCALTTGGPLTDVFGIPVSLIGLIGYVVILGCCIWQFKKVFIGMTAFGMIFCLRITIFEVFKYHVYCPVCLMCQLVMLTLFIISLYNYAYRVPQIEQKS